MEKYLFSENKTKSDVPLFDCSERTLTEIYDFRWDVYHKHIKKTETGYVITEFLPDVPWSGAYNTISCAAGHHIYEGRWLHDVHIINDYADFWFSEKAQPRLYSTWLADAIYKRDCVLGNFEQSKKLYLKLSENFKKWKTEKEAANGLFYQIDDRDGMEFSIGGSGFRPTINSYMYGELCALEKISRLLGKTDESERYRIEKERLRRRINEKLWNAEDEFFETVKEDTLEFVNVREEIGYLPWYFDAADADKNIAWKYLNSKNHFFAEYGPTTAERNHPDFMKEFDHECLWNGPSWPFATSQTLTAMANLLNDDSQRVVSKADYTALLIRYAKSQYVTENGLRRPHIDEDLHPDTGEWIARNTLIELYKTNPSLELGGAYRGTDYNHSTFCDPVITGLVGIRPSAGDVLTINPLASGIEYFCLDGVKYHNRFLTVVWDQNGKKYEKGFSVYADGEKIAKIDDLQPIEVKL